MKLGIIGGGAMGEAVIAAVLRAKVTTPDAVRVADISAKRLDFLRRTYGVIATESNAEVAAGADYVLLALKPQDFEKAAPGLSGPIAADAPAVSIMAGVTLRSLASALGKQALVRAMPNTPAQIGEGMTIWTATPAVSPAAREGVRSILAALGREAFVPEERYLDMATALSGSGPAYVFLFIEALVDAGVHIGLSRDLATTMALQTVVGATRYAEKTNRHPAELRNQVTSPGGTTAEGLRALEAGGLRAAVLDAVIAAFEKSKALGEASQK